MVTEEILRERARSREEVRLSHEETKFEIFAVREEIMRERARSREEARLSHGGRNSGIFAVTGRGTTRGHGDPVTQKFSQNLQCARSRACALQIFYRSPRPRCYQNNPRCHQNDLMTEYYSGLIHILP